MKFHKYQALGNDYLVLEAPSGVPTTALSRKICDRHYGVGSDGILLQERGANGGFALRIINPDGSEAEKSGNGLRIFARYLWDTDQVGTDFFEVETRGGTVRCQVREAGKQVFVEMGRASFSSERIPILGPKREVVAEPISVAGRELRFTGVTVGNPHCVIHLAEVSAERARELGPPLETHALFPNRSNVQLVRVLNEHHIQIEIWERGAGYTLASGSSSCAAAAASVRLGLCSGDVKVTMPGGELQIGVSPSFELTMLGPADKVAEGTLAAELLSGSTAH